LADLADPGKKVHGQLYTILGNQRSEVVSVQGRDILDISSGIRAIVSGIIGDVSRPGGWDMADEKVKSGMTGLDLLDNWWKGHKHCMTLCDTESADRADETAPTVIIHIQDAQIIPPQVLGEIIYIITQVPSFPLLLITHLPSPQCLKARLNLTDKPVYIPKYHSGSSSQCPRPVLS
jgi:hypothetical protein